MAQIYDELVMLSLAVACFLGQFTNRVFEQKDKVITSKRQQSSPFYTSYKIVKTAKTAVS